MQDLTRCEIRRLMEGQRVHEEIKSKMRDMKHDTGTGNRAAMGRTVPRESDKKLLEEHETNGDGGLKSGGGSW